MSKVFFEILNEKEKEVLLSLKPYFEKQGQVIDIVPVLF
jgi:hypothetical protein